MDEQTNDAPDIGLAATWHRIDASWRSWLAALDAIPTARLSEPGVCDAWSAKDLTGHVAYWDADALDDIARIASGGERQPQDVDTRNAADAAANADRSVTDLRAEMERTHDLLLAALRGLAPDDPRTRQICREIAEDTWQHYQEHEAHVRAWRAREGT